MITVFIFVLCLLKHIYLAVLSTTAFLWIQTFKQKHLSGFFIILIFAVLLFTNLLDIFKNVRDISISIYENKERIIEEALRPSGGIDYISPASIPEEAKVIKKLVTKHDIPNFNILGNLKSDTLKFQRIIEINWPVKLDNYSKYLFFLSDEFPSDICDNWRIIDQEGGISLVVCP